MGLSRSTVPDGDKESPMRKRAENTERKQPRIGLADAHRLQEVASPMERLRQLLMPLVAGAVETRRGLMAWSHDVGIETLKEIFDDDVERVVGPEGKHQPVRVYNRWGSTATELEFGGRRISVPRPRVRQRGGGEVDLPTVKQLKAIDPLPDTVLSQILLGVSTRGYDTSVPPPPAGTRSRVTSRSAVSRQLARRMEEKMRMALGASLDQVRLVGMLVDGIEIGDYTIVVALGVTTGGAKVPLGLHQGSTKNAAVCTALLNRLVERGLRIEDPILCVVDGGKGIRKALRDVFGHLAVVQRCTVHKRRNIHDHLPKHRQASIDRQLQDAYASKTADTARKRLRQIGSWLARNGEDSAAASLKEGLEETLTVIKLELPDVLRKFFSTTNAIENLMGGVRKVTRNVKRWRSGRMACRWVTAAVENARSRFHNIKGHQSLSVLVAALRVHAKTLEVQEHVS
jgi:transposase-like protein